MNVDFRSEKKDFKNYNLDTRLLEGRHVISNLQGMGSPTWCKPECLGWPTFYAGSGVEKGASHSGSVHKDAAPDRPRWETETV